MRRALALIACMGLSGCAKKPLRVGAGTTVVLTVGFAAPLSTDCTDCTARDYATIWGLSFVGSALVGALVAHVLAEDGDAKPKKPPADEGAPVVPTVNARCADSKRTLIKELNYVQCGLTGIRPSAADGLREACGCAQVGDRFECMAPPEPVCATNGGDQIGLGVASARFKSAARAEALGAARAMCNASALQAHVTGSACSCDTADCICTVVAECAP